MKIGGVRAFVWDVVLERVFRHYSVSSGVVRRNVVLRPTDVVLDVGGGTGGVCAPLAGEAGRIIVIEPAEDLVRRGRSRFSGLDFVRAAGERLPVRDASVDAALLVEVLHHVPDERALLSEAARVLKPGGRLLIEEVEFTGLWRLAYWAESVIARHVWPRTREKLGAQLASLGFRSQILEQEGFVILAVRL